MQSGFIGPMGEKGLRGIPGDQGKKTEYCLVYKVGFESESSKNVLETSM
jgi:hypothetical protein